MLGNVAERGKRYFGLNDVNKRVVEAIRPTVALTVIVVLILLGYVAFSKQAKPSPNSYPNFRVQFFDQNFGVIIGPRVFHTKDSGRTWLTIDYVNPSDSFKAKDGPRPAKHLVQFVDADWAWRISPKDAESVEYSSDGGRSWSQPIRTGVKARSSIVFLTRELGWVLGEVSVVTRDGGETWRPVTPLSGLRFDCPFFLDPNHGWVSNYWGVIGRTEDGGEHWSILRTPLKQVRSLFFLTSDHGWAVGDNGLVASTENGGVDWKIRDAQVPFDAYRQVRTELLDVFFLTSEMGWIVGQSGLVLLTKDGGESWHRVSTPTKATLSSVRFTNLLHGWAVGGHDASSTGDTPPSNVVLETSDGGHNWIIRTF